MSKKKAIEFGGGQSAFEVNKGQGQKMPYILYNPQSEVWPKFILGMSIPLVSTVILLKLMEVKGHWRSESSKTEYRVQKTTAFVNVIQESFFSDNCPHHLT